MENNKDAKTTKAEILKNLSIDEILLALHEFCFGKEEHCEDCQYLNKDGSCQVFETIDRTGEFLDPVNIPAGDNMEDGE